MIIDPENGLSVSASYTRFRPSRSGIAFTSMFCYQMKEMDLEQLGPEIGCTVSNLL